MPETVNILALLVEADKIIKRRAVKHANTDIPLYPPGTGRKSPGVPRALRVSVPLVEQGAFPHDPRTSSAGL